MLLKYICLLVMHCIMFGSGFPEADEGYSPIGRYTLFSCIRENQDIISEHHAEFAFDKSGNGFGFEIIDNDLHMSIYSKMKWLYRDGVMYHSLHTADQMIEESGNVVGCQLKIRDDGYLPEFGRHYALPPIMVYAPKYVIEESPRTGPTVPVDIHKPQFAESPERVFCNCSLFDENNPGSALRMLEAFSESSVADM